MEASVTSSDNEEEKEFKDGPIRESPAKYRPLKEDHPEIVVEKSKSKLERLLAQSDIFDCLRRIN